MSHARATSSGSRPSGNRRHDAGRDAEVPSITSAPEPLEEDQARRTRRYLVQMGIRIVCFIGAVLVDELWIRLTLVAAAVVLPYSAVLFANAGRDRVSYDTSPMVDVAPAELPAPASRPGSSSAPETFDGAHRVVEHRDDEPDDAPDGQGPDQGPDQDQGQGDPTDENRGGDR
ncbi:MULTISPECIES: DUF3099 domain-containing protein [unclassified Isoptericola]|uniref:DUF3099 domain-containing protein n=1 Tax=unclassified Isoptericola TaxID=2623355 RepID=UPI00364839B7